MRTKQLIVICTLFVNLFLVFPITSFCQTENIASSTKFKIKFTETASKNGLNINPKNINKTKSGVVLTGIESIDDLNEKYQVTNLKRIFPYAGSYEWKHIKHGLHLWYEFEIIATKSNDIKSCIENYSLDKNVAISEPYYAKQIIGYEPGSLITTPVNDPRYNEQWHYHNTGQTGGTSDADIDLPEAWQIEAGSDNVIVAIIDGGVDYNHNDLSGAMWTNTTELNGTAGVDDDGNGYIDDIHGYGFGDGIGEYYPHNHGTHVGGTVGATNNNGVGVCGIAGGNNGNGGVRLMSCATFGSYGVGGFDAAFVYAADNGAVISQNSWGYTSTGYYEQSVLDAIDYFIANAGYDANGNPIGPMQGGLVVFAAGNDNTNGAHYPAYYNPCFAVASTNHNDQKSYYSNYGPWVDIAAPGGETNASSNRGVLSTLPGNSYGYYMGTSMACPHVSGVAALIVSKYGGNGLTPNMVRDRMINTTDNIDNANSSYIGLLGSGRLNAFKSLIEDDGIAPNPISDLSITNNGTISTELQWTATGFSADSGAATIYDMRYATFEITDANFNTATKVRNTPTPAISGTTENFEITGLRPETTYWFAIKASDYFGNISEISNIVSVTTDQAPIISFTPNYLVHSIDSGFETTLSGNIGNIGSVNLDFYIPPFSQVTNTVVNNTEYINFANKLSKDEPDTRIGHPVLNNSGNDGKSGAGYSWIDSDSPNGPDFNWIDISSIGTSLSFGLDDAFKVNLPFSFPFYGQSKTSVYISSNGFLTFNSLNAIEYINEQIPQQSNPNDLIAFMWDDFDARKGGTVHYFTDASKLIVQYTDIKQYSSTYSYTLQVILYKNGVIKMQYLELDRGTNSCTVGIENSDGREGMQIAFNTTYLHDDLALLITPPNRFVTDASPTSGTILPGNAIDVDFTVNSIDLVPGNYFDSVAIESNDPLKPIAYYPIQLHVNGIPKIEVNIDSISFDTMFVDVIDSLPITIINSGNDSLLISDLSIQDGLFSLDQNLSEIKLYNEQQKTFYIYFNPLNDISYYDTLEITNNTSNNLIRIPLFGHAIYPPVASIDPKVFNFNLFSGDSVTDVVNIDNSLGQSELFFQASKIIFTENANIKNHDFSLKSHIVETVSPDLNNRIDINCEYLNSSSFKNLNGKSIGVLNKADLSIINSDIVQRGGVVFELTLPITTSQIEHLDVLIFDDNISNLSTSEINLIRENVAKGLSLSVFADNSGSVTNFSRLFTNTGISPVSHGFTDFNLTNFENHPSTNNISQIHCVAAGYTYNISATAKPLAYDVDGNCRFAISKIGSGKVAAFCNENMHDTYMGSADNRLFANQLIDWLSGTSAGWLSISSEVDTVAAGDIDQQEFKIKTTDMLAGKYMAKICYETNAPNLLVDTVMVNLNLSGHAVLETSVDTIKHDSIYVGIKYNSKVILNNIGTDTLKISSINTTTSDIVVDTNMLEILPDDKYELLVEITPSNNDAFNDSIIINSNDSSGVSAIISIIGKAYLPPVCNVSTDTIKAELYTGTNCTDSLIITNTGGNLLSYKISTQYTAKVDTTFPKIQSVGDYHYLGSSPTYLTGMVTDSKTGFIYALEQYGGNLYQYNPYDSAWSIMSYGPYYFSNYSKSIILNNKIYIGTKSSNLLYIYDIDNKSWSSISTNISNTCIFDTDGSNLYFFSYNDFKSFNPTTNLWINLNANNQFFDYDGSVSFYNNKLYIQNGAGNFYSYNILNKSWQSLARPINTSFYGSAIDPSTETLYAYYNSTLYKYSIKSDLWSTEIIPVFQGRQSGITYCDIPEKQGIYFSEGYLGYDFMRYETPNTYKWLTIKQTSDNLQPNESKLVNLHFNSQGLKEAQYKANISISSNDPSDSIKIVPVILNVRNAANLTLSNDSIIFNEALIGYSETKQVTISNFGTDTLVINNIEIGNQDVFSINKTYLTIAPDSSETVLITAETSTTDTINSNVIFKCNAKPKSNVELYVSASGKIAPKLTLPNTDIVAYTLPNQNQNKEFSIINSGGSKLYYNIYGGEILAYDSTSTKYFNNYEEDTYHVFEKSYSGSDSITITITLNGYYSYSWAYAELEIEGFNHGIINDGNLPNGTNCISKYRFAADSAKKWLADNKLEIYIRNKGVQPGYGESKNQVRIETDGVEWFTINDTSGYIAANDTLMVNALFKPLNFKVGNYYSSFKLETNDPLAKNNTIPVTLKVRDQEAPFVKKPLSDRVHYITENELSIDFTDMFFDVNNDKLNYSVNSSNIASVFASNNNTLLNLRLLSAGHTTISIHATDNNFAPVTSQFNILVLENNPVVSTGINSDTIVYINAPVFNMNLNKFFSDSDGDTLSFNVIVENDSVLNYILKDNSIEIEPKLAGSCRITISASDNKNTTASQSFNVSVIENLAPVIVNPVDDILVYSTEIINNIQLSNVYSDPDNDSIFYSVSSTDSNVVIPTLNNDTLCYNIIGKGETTIEILATDTINAATVVIQKISITENNAPIVNSVPSNIITNLYSDNEAMNMANIFNDADNDTLIYKIYCDTSIVHYSLVDSTLVLIPQALGSTTIELYASDLKSDEVKTDFLYTVESINKAPNVINTIKNQIVYATQELELINIGGIFRDPEGDSLVYTIQSSDSSIVIASLNNGVISFDHFAADTALITLYATDQALNQVSITFSVIIVQNSAPSILEPIGKQMVTLDTISTIIKLSNHFVDYDGDKLIYEFLSPTDTITSCSLNDTALIISSHNIGVSNYALAITDGKSKPIITSFSIEVSKANTAPYVNYTLPNIEAFSTATIEPIDISNLFDDYDGDDIDITISSTNSDIISTSLTNDSIHFTLNGIGSSTIIISASDGINEKTQTSFSLSIIENKIPELLAYFNDFNVEVDSTFYLKLDNYFYDADNDKLLYRIFCDKQEIIDWKLLENELKITSKDIGEASFIVYATDGNSNEIYDIFNVRVNEVTNIKQHVSNSLSVYPNPIKNNANVIFHLSKTANTQIKIYSLSGSIIETIDFGYLESGNHNHQINISKLRNSTYYIQLIVDKQNTGFIQILKE